jgi:hypothetical protein
MRVFCYYQNTEHGAVETKILYDGHELDLRIYDMSKLLNTSEFINTINSRLHIIPQALRSRHAPDAIRQRDAIFRFSLIDNFDPSLNFLNI